MPEFAQSKKTGKTSSSKSKNTKESESSEEEEAQAPSDPENLIPNSGFENMAADLKGLKGPGLLKEFSTPWFSPNETSADLFASGIKTVKVSAPDNDYGSQSPLSGSAYAGFRAFTKDPKKSRTYLETKLNKRLEKDHIYCFKFNVSLTETSKSGVNNVGIFISDRKVQNENDNALNFTPQIKEKTNKPLTMMDGWETICGYYIAKGNEEYIIIGCFGPEDKLKFEKVKKPATSTKPQMNETYYFLDDVEVKEIATANDCNCGKAEAPRPDLIYSKSGVKPDNQTPAQMIDAAAIYFAFFSSEVPGMFEQELSDIATALKDNPSIRIELEGHMENEEAEEAKAKPTFRTLDKNRAESVKKALTDLGVDESRISISFKGASNPASTKETPMSKAQNRRVEFIVK
jgi:outer membrane protein OmpA-like peptidoglycan-associated protein